MNKKIAGLAIVSVTALTLFGLLVSRQSQTELHEASTTEQGSETNAKEAVSRDSQQIGTTPNNVSRDWEAYTSKEGRYMFKHPKNWSFANDLERCDNHITLMGASVRAAGSCVSGSSQVFISSSAGDTRQDNNLDSNVYSQLSTKRIEKSGVTGLKESGVLDLANNDLYFGPASNGDRVTVYSFYTNGRTYIARYIQKPEYPDAKNTFDVLVLDTFEFLD